MSERSWVPEGTECGEGDRRACLQQERADPRRVGTRMDSPSMEPQGPLAGSAQARGRGWARCDWEGGLQPLEGSRAWEPRPGEEGLLGALQATGHSRSEPGPPEAAGGRGRRGTGRQGTGVVRPMAAAEREAAGQRGWGATAAGARVPAVPRHLPRVDEAVQRGLLVRMSGLSQPGAACRN